MRKQRVAKHLPNDPRCFGHSKSTGRLSFIQTHALKHHHLKSVLLVVVFETLSLLGRTWNELLNNPWRYTLTVAWATVYIISCMIKNDIFPSRQHQAFWLFMMDDSSPCAKEKSAVIQKKKQCRVARPWIDGWHLLLLSIEYPWERQLWTAIKEGKWCYSETCHPTKRLLRRMMAILVAVLYFDNLSGMVSDALRKENWDHFFAETNVIGLFFCCFFTLYSSIKSCLLWMYFRYSQLFFYCYLLYFQFIPHVVF